MKRQFFVLLLLACLCPSGSMAQTETEDPSRFDIEVIIFKNTKVPKSREFVIPVSSPGMDKTMLDLSSEKSVAAASELGYELLTTTEFRLIEVATRLVASSRYELLTHVAWRQPGFERDKVLPVWIKGGRIYGNEYTSIDNQMELLESIPQTDNEDEGTSYEFDEQTLESLELKLLEQQALQAHQGLYELEGKISVSLSRYLHVYTDLVLRRPRLSVDPVLGNSAQSEFLAMTLADTRILNNHSLKEHRRMRSKNLHYLDNPEFGLLILITPFEEIEEVVGAEPVPIEPGLTE